MEPRAGGRYSPHLPRAGVGFVPYSPLGRGFLTGTVPIPAFWQRMISAAICRASSRNHAQNQLLLERLQQVATRYDATLAQIALARVMSKGEDIVPIPGRGKLLTCATMPAPRILPSRRRTSSPSNIFSLPTTSLAYAIPGDFDLIENNPYGQRMVITCVTLSPLPNNSSSDSAHPRRLTARQEKGRRKATLMRLLMGSARVDAAVFTRHQDALAGHDRRRCAAYTLSRRLYPRRAR